MNIREEKRFITSDGQTFKVLQEAEAHEARYQFFEWCRANICRGGEWDADMVAHAIWENFIVSRRSEEDAQ